MKLPIFTTVVIMSALTWLYMKYSSQKGANDDEAFWEREREANSTRKKPLSDLDYITIPFDALPFDVQKEEEEIRKQQEILRSLEDRKIVNLNGISNTDLKLRYGVANFPIVSEFDANYTTLLCAVSAWGTKLYEAGEKKAAKTVLEYSVSIGSDIRSDYLNLADLYEQENAYDKIDALIESAQALTSLTGKALLKELKKRSLFSPSYR